MLYQTYNLLCCVVLVLLIHDTSGYGFEGIYCGKENCYDVLGVTRDSNRNEIAKNYRALAKKFHPDRHRDPQAKLEASERFKQIATAYEILRDDEERADYDYMLDNPEEYYAHYYRYYSRRMAPKVDVRIVIAVTITVISIIQYYSAWSKYESAITYFMTVPKYRTKALEIAKDETKELQGKSKEKKKVSKSDQKIQMEKIIRRVIEENMDIKGSYAKPEIMDILWIQIIILPYTLCMYSIWYFKWIWKFTILRHAYGREEKLYLIRKNMGMGTHQFKNLDDATVEDYFDEELWIKENYIQWKEIQDEEMKKSLAENNKYKQYRRYIKKGANRMTFDDS